MLLFGYTFTSLAFTDQNVFSNSAMTWLALLWVSWDPDGDPGVLHFPELSLYLLVGSPKLSYQCDITNRMFNSPRGAGTFSSFVFAHTCWNWKMYNYYLAPPISPGCRIQSLSSEEGHKEGSCAGVAVCPYLDSRLGVCLPSTSAEPRWHCGFLRSLPSSESAELEKSL